MSSSSFTVLGKPHKGKPRRRYEMVVTPEGYAVHQGEGCDGEPFNGVLGCWHAKEYSKVTTALIKSEGILTPAPISFSREQMQVITDTICKGATPTELQYFVQVCQRTGLDPFMGQIYAVKRYDSSERRQVMAIQIGVDGRRLIAERTDKFAGMDPIEWLDTDGVWSEVWSGVGEHPVAARTAAYRKDWPDHKATAVCRWDSFAQYLGSEKKLSPTWEKMPDHMLGKCAENLALKRAFPAEMSFIDQLTGGYDASVDTDAWIEPKQVIDGQVIDRETGEIIDAPTHEATQGTAREVDESPVRPATAEQSAAAPATSPDNLPELRTRLSKRLAEVKSSIGRDWNALNIELHRDFPAVWEGDTLALPRLDADTIAAIDARLRRAMGEPEEPPV